MLLIITVKADNLHFGENKFLAADVDGDGHVGFTDLLTLSGAFRTNNTYSYGFGNEEFNPDCDFDEDGKIEFSDLAVLSSQYGKKSPWHTPNFDWEVIADTEYWARSYTASDGLTWYFDDKGHCNMSMLYYVLSWSNVGLFQGTKPFGWGSANRTWTPFYVEQKQTPENATCLIDWGFTLNYADYYEAYGGQTNLGIDIWFEIYHPTQGWLTGEFYDFVYMEGKQIVPINHTIYDIRSEEDNKWYFVEYHSMQAQKEQFTEVHSISLNYYCYLFAHTCMLYDETPFPSDWTDTKFYVKAIDFTAEGKNCEIRWTLDYAYVHYNPT